MILFAGLSVCLGQAKADIICKGQSQMGPAQVDISDGAVIISGAGLDQPQVYRGLSGLWDGHQTELITAPGLSVSYQDWYGCIHNARITANFRSSDPFFDSIVADQCSGGSTPDEVCKVPN